jgi:hypothetical protein
MWFPTFISSFLGKASSSFSQTDSHIDGSVRPVDKAPDRQSPRSAGNKNPMLCFVLICLSLEQIRLERHVFLSLARKLE